MTTTHNAQQCHGQLGATPPEIILKSLNVGLTNNHMKLGNPYAYSFTKALKRDLQEIFQLQHAHGLFLCEMDSQKPYECTDKVFHERCIAAASGDYIKPKHAQDVNFVDTSDTLRKYLQETLKACKLEDLQIHSLPPYAYIGDPSKLSVSPPEFFNPLPSNTQRHAVRFNVVFRPTGEHLRVICDHSPSPDGWVKNVVRT